MANSSKRQLSFGVLLKIIEFCSNSNVYPYKCKHIPNRSWNFCDVRLGWGGQSNHASGGLAFLRCRYHAGILSFRHLGSMPLVIGRWLRVGGRRNSDHEKLTGLSRRLARGPVFFCVEVGSFRPSTADRRWNNHMIAERERLPGLDLPLFWRRGGLKTADLLSGILLEVKLSRCMLWEDCNVVLDQHVTGTCDKVSSNMLPRFPCFC